MAAYDNYFAGKLEDVALDEGEIERALQAIEGLPAAGLGGPSSVRVNARKLTRLKQSSSFEMPSGAQMGGEKEKGSGAARLRPAATPEP